MNLNLETMSEQYNPYLLTKKEFEELLKINKIVPAELLDTIVKDREQRRNYIPFSYRRIYWKSVIDPEYELLTSAAKHCCYFKGSIRKFDAFYCWVGDKFPVGIQEFFDDLNRIDRDDLDPIGDVGLPFDVENNGDNWLIDSGLIDEDWHNKYTHFIQKLDVTYIFENEYTDLVQDCPCPALSNLPTIAWRQQLRSDQNAEIDWDKHFTTLVNRFDVMSYFENYHVYQDYYPTPFIKDILSSQSRAFTYNVWTTVDKNKHLTNNPVKIKAIVTTSNCGKTTAIHFESETRDDMDLIMIFLTSPVNKYLTIIDESQYIPKDDIRWHKN